MIFRKVQFMEKSMNEYAALYKTQLEIGNIQIAYERLVKYVMTLRAHIEKNTEYQVGNVSPGYMDFTYFPFFNEYLRERKLRFGIVLNHREMRFELWLMGQNAEVQTKYWKLLKKTEWNRHLANMPKYSALETVLEAKPDFDNLDALTLTIERVSMEQVNQIVQYIE